MTEAQKKALKSKTDCAQVFLVFMSLVGDVAKTATALDLDPEFVQWLAETEGWMAKIKRVSMMSKGERPGDFERAINRAMIFTQAHQMRGLLDKVLRHARGLEEDELMKKCSNIDRTGAAHFSAKFFTDMAQAIETVSRVSLVALGDTVTERVEREESKDSDGLSASAMHQAILAALNNPVVGSESSELLVREQAGNVRLLKTVNETSQAIDAEVVVAYPPSELKSSESLVS